VFEVTKIVANAWNKNLNKLSQNKNSKNVFLNNGKSYQLSDLRKNIPLGNTLELISKKGVREFYEGSFKDLTISFVIEPS
jgi:gamma-glutamyltranspeptidase